MKIYLLFAIIVVSAALANAAESLIAPGGEVKKLAGDFAFTEGPAADRDGNIYFSDIPNNRIMRWGNDGQLSTFRENSGGANGLCFDKQGNLLACEGGARRLTSISPAGEVTVLADSYEGKKLNSPNDLWIDPQGGVYFSDPRYGNMEGLELPGFYVFYLTPDRKKLTAVITDMVKPNGVLGSADGKQLFVADAGGSKTYLYMIQADGSLTDKKLFAGQGSDGLARDEQGNIYLTGGGITVYAPGGEKLETIAVPEGPANLKFGGPDRKTLYITARTSFYAVPMRVRGQ
ncbi:MAG TPA: SMP-30/gluconolactonase/LRE family protein [Pirellulales bacterium]|nr:SMP-30/gluconolactonase/LRE family protein [Pirellulales bacterium]